MSNSNSNFSVYFTFYNAHIGVQVLTVVPASMASMFLLIQREQTQLIPANFVFEVNFPKQLVSISPLNVKIVRLGIHKTKLGKRIVFLVYRKFSQ